MEQILEDHGILFKERIGNLFLRRLFDKNFASFGYRDEVFEVNFVIYFSKASHAWPLFSQIEY